MDTAHTTEPASLSLRGSGILTFANDWTADPTSKHHVMKRFSRSNQVLWIETSGMRAPRLGSTSDQRRLLLKLRTMFRSARQVSDRVHALSPPAIPYPQSSVAERVNSISYRISVRRALRQLGMDRAPDMFAFAPHCAPRIRSIPRRSLTYYCVDRWGAFKGYHRATMEAHEEELCQRADLVLASAEDLAERCAQHSTNVHYIPHGVDHEHFSQALRPGRLPEDLAGIPEPRVGFFGLLHEWVDLELIGRLADVLPYSFVLIGSTSEDLSDLKRRDNVFYLGRRPFATLPDYCRGFHAALVPFRITELTKSVNPIKLQEYAAAGLRVVSSDLPEVRREKEIATCVTTFDGWVDAVTEAVQLGQDDTARQQQSDRVRSNDWNYVCERIAGLVNALR